MERIICRGAEAVIILKDNAVIKERVRKSYRLPELDEKIRKLRTRSETKLLEKASKIINAPIPYTKTKLKTNREMGWGIERLDEENIKNKFTITMPFIDGKKLSEHLDDFLLKKQKGICRQIGKSVAKLHNSNIIHGDLTTSNMIYVDDFNEKNRMNKSNDKIKNDSIINNSPSGWEGGNKRASASQNFRIYFIDFGLGFISHKIEDKAVDLHLLKEALKAKHFKNWEILFGKVLKNYKFRDSKKVIEQLKKVEKRGRYKGNY